MGAFILAVCLLLITPGPGVLSTAGVGAAFGFRSGIRYVLGLFIGTNLVALAVVTGLAALLLATPVIRTLLAVLSAAYLMYMALRIAFAGSHLGFIAAQKRPGISEGIALQAINPKAYIVNTTLFSGFVIWPYAVGFEMFTKFIIVNSIWIPIHLVWLYAGASLKRLNPSPKTQSVINKLMAAALIGVVVLAGVTLNEQG